MEGSITKTNVDEVVESLTGAESVIIAPGYVLNFVAFELNVDVGCLDMEWPWLRLSLRSLK